MADNDTTDTAEAANADEVTVSETTNSNPSSAPAAPTSESTEQSSTSADQVETEALALKKTAENDVHTGLRALLDKFEGDAEAALAWLKAEIEKI